MIHKYDKSTQIHYCIAHILPVSTQLLLKSYMSIPLGRNRKTKSLQGSTQHLTHWKNLPESESKKSQRAQGSLSLRYNTTVICARDVGDETSWALPFFFVLSKTSSSHLSRPSDGKHGVSAGISIRNQRRVGRLTVSRSGLLHWDEFGERTVRSIHCSRAE